MEVLLKTEKLTKSYGTFQAVSDLSLQVHKGEIYGFIGLNGAGKTTTIRMLLGMIRPDSGRACIFGEEVQAEKTWLWKNTGYMVEAPTHYPNLTVRENLELTRKMRLLDDKQAVDRVSEQLQLSKYLDRKAKNLSQGNSQRLGLAKALIHGPALLILDEPTNALDPAGIVEIRELLVELASRHGVTILVSSHILDEVARFSSRIGIIHNGNLIREMSRDELQDDCRKGLLIDTHDNTSALNLLSERGISGTLNHDGLLEVSSPNAIAHPEELVEVLVNQNLSPFRVQTYKEDLESYFLRTIHS